MDKADKIASSLARGLLEQKLLAGIPVDKIVQEIATETGEAFDVDAINLYRKRYLEEGKGLMNDCIAVSKDLSKFELPAVSEVDTLSSYFSFKKTNEDLTLIYDRIRELNTLARQNPDNDSFDKRISEYIKRADCIKDRIIKGQYEDLRKSLLLNMGKKLVVAAIGELMPYIPYAKRDEAKRKFMSAIEPLINNEMVPPDPADIIDIKKAEDGR
jgi:hypothetical protein